MNIVPTQAIDLRALLSRQLVQLEEVDESPSLPKLDSELVTLYVTRAGSGYDWAEFEWIIEDAGTGSMADYPEWTASAVESFRAAFLAELMNGKLEHTVEALPVACTVIQLPAPASAGERGDLVMAKVDSEVPEPWGASVTINMEGASPAEVREIALQMLRLSFIGDLLQSSTPKEH